MSCSGWKSVIKWNLSWVTAGQQSNHATKLSLWEAVSCHRWHIIERLRRGTWHKVVFFCISEVSPRQRFQSKRGCQDLIYKTFWRIQKKQAALVKGTCYRWWKTLYCVCPRYTYLQPREFWPEVVLLEPLKLKRHITDVEASDSTMPPLHKKKKKHIETEMQVNVHWWVKMWNILSGI